MKFTLWLLLFLLLPFASYAEPQPLPAEKAFQIKVYLQKDDQLKIVWKIAPHYYLYSDKVHFSFLPDSKVKGGTITLPPGQKRNDEIHGAYQIYTGELAIEIPILNTDKNLLHLNIFYQGCSTDGLCYAPIKKELNINLTRWAAPADLTKQLSASRASIPAQGQATILLEEHKFLFIILAFLGLGILLAFTPCVLPMIPILSGIIVGYHRKEALTTRRASFLSLAYVLGMALTYMVLGIFVALLGNSFQAYMQTPWVIGVFSLFFVALALSLLGVYELHFPKSWQMQIMKWDEHFKRGTYPGVFMMGCFSSLIVSPCISAPLVGVLAYIAQAGNVILGAFALLALGIGMGIPLIIFGMAAGKFLPKSGQWMMSIQKIMGILMLGMAVWLLSRVLPPSASVMLWGALLIISAFILKIFQTVETGLEKILKIIAVGFFIYGILLIISAELNNKNPMEPWQIFSTQCALQNQNLFTIIKSTKQLDQQFSLGRHSNRPIILDFYADWCSDCKNIERTIFNDPETQDALRKFILLRVDLTKNSDFNELVQKKFHVEGPPAILFFNTKNHEYIFQRIVGEVSKKEFLRHLHEIEP